MKILLVGMSRDLDERGLIRHGVISCDASETELRRRLNRSEVSWVVLAEGKPEDQLFHLFTVCREAAEGVRLAVLGPEGDHDRCRKWLRLGADVYLSNKTDLTRLLGSLTAADGFNVTVLERGFSGSMGLQQHREALSILSERESEVLSMVADGLNNRQIAERLFITSRTVAFHMSNILAKLGARNRTHAVEVARLLGL